MRLVCLHRRKRRRFWTLEKSSKASLLFDLETHQTGLQYYVHIEFIEILCKYNYTNAPQSSVRVR